MNTDIASSEMVDPDSRSLQTGQKKLAVLDKANVVGVFPKATTADIKTVLANNTETRCANTATARTFAVAFGVRTPDIFVTHCCKEMLGRKNKRVWNRASQGKIDDETDGGKDNI